MNTRSSGSGGSIMPFAVSFNSKGTSFAVAHDRGYTVFDVKNGDRKAITRLDSELRYAAMIDDTQYVAVASLFGADVALWDNEEKRLTGRKLSLDEVRSLWITRARLVVVCQSFTHLYKIGPFEKLAVFETADNEPGLCALGTSMFAIPGRAVGQVQVIDLETGRAKQIVPAHNSTLRAIDISVNDRYVATASEKGTLFRIFSLPDATKVAELRRGMESARIYSIKMSPDNAYLAVTSDKGTLHTFSLAYQPPESTTTSGTPMSRSGSSKGVPMPARKASSDSTSVARSYSPARASPKLSHLAASPTAEYIMVGTSPPQAEQARRDPSQRYGGLSKLPFAPSFVKDHYPDASVGFDVGPISAAASRQEMPGAPTRGQIKWLDDTTFVVVRVQPSCFWEKFRLQVMADSSLHLARSAYKVFELD